MIGKKAPGIFQSLEKSRFLARETFRSGDGALLEDRDSVHFAVPKQAG
jgi:hypothetical protein